jgi:hypothetical protein
MSILTACPSCQKRLKIPDSKAGRTGRCPRCKGVVVVPPLDNGDNQLDIANLSVETEEGQPEAIVKPRLASRLFPIGDGAKLRVRMWLGGLCSVLFLFLFFAFIANYADKSVVVAILGMLLILGTLLCILVRKRMRHASEGPVYLLGSTGSSTDCWSISPHRDLYLAF